LLHEEKDINKGVNAETLEVVDMIQAGILDPTKVVKSAIVGACRVASLMLTTEGIIAEEPKEKDDKKKSKNDRLEDEDN